ncbi:MFS general substrate transporter [Clavulina sp. PMI_390]|nr:MFS general substrate transporter [Clavulina sp. PMI_390]
MALRFLLLPLGDGRMGLSILVRTIPSLSPLEHLSLNPFSSIFPTNPEILTRFGVFQEYYLTTPPFDQASESTINSIGTIAIAIQFFITPFCITLASRYPHWIPFTSWGSLILYVLSVVAASFAQTVNQLLIFQGVMVGLCGGLIYAPVFVWLSEWFLEKRALSAAIIFCGSGIGGIIFPLVINSLLRATGGHQWTLRILALFIGVCSAVSLLGVKPRVPVARTRHGVARALPRADWGFLMSPEFLAMSTTIMTQALAYYPVSLYIPAFATAIGLSTINGTVALAIFNLSGVLGQILFGHACDKIDYAYIIIFSAIGSALSAFLMWGFAKTLEMTFAFVVVFGAVSSGFSSTAPAASKDIAGTDSQSGIVFGCFEMFKGVAVVVGPIISAHLHQRDSGATSVYGGYGFTQIEVFVGSMMALTAVGGVVTKNLRKTFPRSGGGQVVT